MKRHRVLGFVVGTGLAVGTAGLTASAAVADSSNRGCPEGAGFFFLSTVLIVDELDNGNTADQNGDGFVCARFNRGQSSRNPFESFTIKDNTNPGPGPEAAGPV